jgi:hypothetical protein
MKLMGRLTRREFLQTGATAAMASRMVTGREMVPSAVHGVPEPKRSSAIKYINPQVPTLQLPEYSGTRYVARVPDTLDMAERAALAVHGLTGPTDPEADYEIYWFAVFGNNPPYMYHDWNDHVQVKFHEALPLMRLASGSHLNEEVDQRWMEILVQMQGPDGLLYYPRVGRPWVNRGIADEQFGAMPAGEQFAEPFANGRLLGALALHYKLTGNEFWRRVGERVVDGLTKQAAHREGYAYFSTGMFGVNQVSDSKVAPESLNPWMNMTFGWITIGLAQFYRATGYEPALTLSGELARYTRDHSRLYDAEGRFTNIALHFHGHLHPLLGMLEYGMAAGDGEMIEFVRQGFEFGIANMWPMVGYVSEVINPQGYQTSEICGVADMIHMALKLTLAGAGNYWDDVDRWTRNQFAEGQLTSSEWVSPMVKDQPVNLKPLDHGTGATVTEKVPERCVGGFAGWPSANDWQGNKHASIMHCCTGNGTRAIYFVWENILRHEGGKLRVNLLLNRASPWADVDSYIPYEGRVDVKLKSDCELSVRIPEWATAPETHCTVNGRNRPLSWEGRYGVVGKVKPTDVATLTFPIPERKDVLRIHGRDYSLTRKGNEVVHIDPPGKNWPLYQREHYRANSARFKTVERFVADQSVEW